MKDKQILFIKLKPTDPFYFGSERNLSGGENYYALSRQYPQQTTLLGLMRYKILEAYGLLADDYGKNPKNNAVTYIGDKSFVHDKINHQKGYGAIQSITALSLYDGKHFYIPGNRDYGLKYIKSDGTEERDVFLLNIENTNNPLLEGYDIKTWYPPFHWSNGKAILNGSIFQEQNQIGIFKTKGRAFNKNRHVDEDEEKGYYKKTTWIFRNPNMCFSFFATLQNDKAIKLVDYCKNNSMFAQIGGERSLFTFSIESGESMFNQWENELKQNYCNRSGIDQVLLISDAYMEMAAYKHCIFAMTQQTPFRFMTTSVKETDNYYSMQKKCGYKKTLPAKSRLFQLVERGSVFFLNDTKHADLTMAIEEPIAYRQIGYNQYCVLKKDGTIIFKP